MMYIVYYTSCGIQYWGSNPIFDQRKNVSFPMEKKVYRKRWKSIRFPLFPYTFFFIFSHGEKWEKAHFSHGQKWGWTHTYVNLLYCVSYQAPLGAVPSKFMEMILPKLNAVAAEQELRIKTYGLGEGPDVSFYNNIAGAKTTAAQNEVALSCHRVRRVYFVAVIFAATTVIIPSVNYNPSSTLLTRYS